MRRKLLALAVVGLALAGCGGGGGNANAVHVPEHIESANEKTEALQRAFAAGSGTGTVSSEVMADVEQLFASLTKAGANRNADAALVHFDFEYLQAAAEASGMTRGASEAERAGILAGFKKGARESWFKAGAGVFEWVESRVMRVEKTTGDQFLLAYVRHDVDYDGVNMKARWWLVQRDGAWRVFDWEVLNTGMRVSRLMGCMTDPKNVPPWVGKLSLIQSARAKLDQGDHESARVDLERAADARMPIDLEAVRLEMIGTCDYHAEKYESALERFERVLKLKPDFPDARYMRGSTLFNLGRHEEAVTDLKWYVETLGSDAMAMTELANCLTWLDRFDEALVYYRGSMRELPQVETVFNLAKFLPDEKTAELREWFLMIKDRDEAFTYLADQLYFENYFPAALKEICEAFRTVRPTSHELAYYSGRLLLDDDKPAEAANMLRPTLTARGKKLEDYRAWYWEAMYLSAQGLKAFAEASGAEEKKAAFLALTEDYHDNSDAVGLNALCRGWKEDGAKEPALHFYLGEAAFIKEDWVASEKHFREGLPLIRKGKEFYVGTRHGLWHAIQKQCRSLEAYAEFKPASEVFAYMEVLLFDDAQQVELEKLTAAHAEAQPKDYWLHRAAGDLGWLKKDWGMARAGYKTYFRPEAREDENYWGVAERCIRAALRGGDGELAEKTARTALATQNDWLLVIALAGSDKPAEAIASFEKLIEGETEETAAEWMNEFYADEDIGQKLRAEAYSKLHKRFAVPAAEPPPVVPPGD